MPFGARGGSSTPLPSFTPPRHPAGRPVPLSSGAVAEKIALARIPRSDSWIRRRIHDSFVPLRIGTASRGIYVPVLRLLHPAATRQTSLRTSRAAAGYSVASIFIALLGTALFWLALLLAALSFVRPWLPERRSLPFMEPSTLIFPPEHIERVWQWEIAAGHYPSRREINFDWPTLASQRIENPAIPKRTEEDERRERQVQAEVRRRLGEAHQHESRGRSSLRHPDVVPIGHHRRYIDIPGRPVFRRSRYSVPPSDFPQRPAFGAALDMDLVMDHCDFGRGKYVRDCLEVLRMNAGLDTGVRRGNTADWRLSYSVEADRNAQYSLSDHSVRALLAHEQDMTALLNSSSFGSLLPSRQALTLSHVVERSRPPHSSHQTADPDCDPDYPRIFHMFWAGPFTDKPYVAALSFLYSQNLDLHRRPSRDRPFDICRPQMWIWINPGPASSFPDPTARTKMRRELSNNPWSAPLLHPRFRDVIKFKLWNTTEHLDAIPEMHGWREMRLFNSGGVKYGNMPKKEPSYSIDLSDTADDKVAEAAAREGAPPSANVTANATIVAAPLPSKAKDELFERVGSTSAKGYDRLSVVLSDMARFVLTHRFGGVYLDADTLLLRDWEELWGSSFSFVYRWSRLDKLNSAIMKMHRQSALGNFIFRTAVANGLDFHPMTISRYLKDAKLESLMLRLPDALFDPAWLNTEYYQRDRPPQPYFRRFEDFFETPQDQGAAPLALGFDGFFRGAFCHHWHNFWWKAFDPSRNFPDLGPRFERGERLARGRLLAARLASQASAKEEEQSEDSLAPSPTKPAPPKGASANRPAVNLDESAGVVIATHIGGSRWGDDERDFEALDWSNESVLEDDRDLSWSAVVKRTFEAYLRGERPNMYGEWLDWGEEGESDERAHDTWQEWRDDIDVDE